MTASQDLPDDVIEAIRAGGKIEAIKLLRMRWNVGLKEAKEAVEAYTGGELDAWRAAGERGARPAANERDELPADVIQALQARRKIEAITLLRGHWKLGLAEAKEAVEAYAERHSVARPTSLVTHDPGPARFVVLVVAVVILYLVYRYFAGP